MRDETLDEMAQRLVSEAVSEEKLIEDFKRVESEYNRLSGLGRSGEGFESPMFH